MPTAVRGHGLARGLWALQPLPPVLMLSGEDDGATGGGVGDGAPHRPTHGGSRGTARGLEEPLCLTEEDCFAQGYLDAGGPPVYLRHLLEDVRPCEGAWGVRYENGYVSAFQFAPSSWSTSASATGFWEPLDPYSVGVNVAWWIQHIDNPGSTAGWPVCFHTGGWP